jgi:flagellar basal body-associated protein FliL
MNTDTTLQVLVFVVLFSVGFFAFLWFLSSSKKDASSIYYVETRVPLEKNVNAASETTQQRKERTLDNPVVKLNGKDVYLTVNKNPPR